MIDETLGRYRITGKLGEGGMGIVYRAYDDQLQRDLAIKLLSNNLLHDSLARARMIREARAAAALNHPNICTIYEVGEADGQVYIAMELVDGPPLHRQLESGPLPAEEVLRLGRQLADALGHAHERGIVHRDLKSLNVMITSGGRCKVMDFGLATRLTSQLSEATAPTLLTEAGELAGTPAYMAPEQLQGHAADARSDVWALGVMLYEMAAGKRPFTGNTAFEVTSAILSKPPGPLPANVHGALRAVIERCLAKDPKNRYAQGGEVRADLESILEGNSSLRHVRRLRPGRRTVAASAGVLILAGLGAALNIDRLRKMLASLTEPVIRSVAVLPLANLSGDASQDYLADGMTDALITDLSRFGGLERIIGRGSMMSYKGTAKPYPEIAKELKVESLITGSVFRSQDQVSVLIQLNSADGEQLWADRFDRGFGDLLQLQRDIVNRITQELRLRMTPEERERMARAHAVNPAAYEAYLKGMIHWYKHTPEDIDQAANYFELALEKDPAYPLAYRGMAFVWTYRASGLMRPREVALKINEIVERMKAQGLDEDQTQGEYFEGVADAAFYYGWNWESAGEHYRRALDLKPNSVDLRLFYWDYLASMNRMKEAGDMLVRCLELDPFNAFAHGSYGLYLLLSQQYDAAIKQFRKMLDDKTDFGLAHLSLWTAYHHKGMFREAYDEARAGFEGSDEFQKALEEGYRNGGYPGAMRRAADLMVEGTQINYILPTNIARLYAYAGDKEKALEQLEAGYADLDGGMVHLQVDPDWKDLRNEPRFQRLLQLMKFPK